MAADCRVLWKPGSGVTRTLLLVGGAVRCDEVQRIIGQALAFLGREPLGSLLPGVTQGHHMVDLDGAAALGSAPEVHVLARVGFPEVPGRHFAGGPLGEHNAGKVPAKDVVPRVAAVPVDIKPSLAEGLTAVA